MTASTSHLRIALCLVSTTRLPTINTTIRRVTASDQGRQTASCIWGWICEMPAIFEAFFARLNAVLGPGRQVQAGEADGRIYEVGVGHKYSCHPPATRARPFSKQHHPAAASIPAMLSSTPGEKHSEPVEASPRSKHLSQLLHIRSQRNNLLKRISRAPRVAPWWEIRSSTFQACEEMSMWLLWQSVSLPTLRNQG